MFMLNLTNEDKIKLQKIIENKNCDFIRNCKDCPLSHNNNLLLEDCDEDNIVKNSIKALNGNNDLSKLKDKKFLWVITIYWINAINERYEVLMDFEELLELHKLRKNPSIKISGIALDSILNLDSRIKIVNRDNNYIGYKEFFRSIK